MNKLVSVMLLGTALTLSACGGDSDSSGNSNNTNDNPVTPTTPTNPTTPTTPTTPTATCATTGSSPVKISVPNNSSCTFSIPNLIEGTVQTYKCNNGTLTTPLGISGGTTTIGGFEFSCAK